MSDITIINTFCFNLCHFFRQLGQDKRVAYMHEHEVEPIDVEIRVEELSREQAAEFVAEGRLTIQTPSRAVRSLPTTGPMMD